MFTKQTSFIQTVCKTTSSSKTLIRKTQFQQSSFSLLHYKAHKSKSWKAEAGYHSNMKIYVKNALICIIFIQLWLYKPLHTKHNTRLASDTYHGTTQTLHWVTANWLLTHATQSDKKLKWNETLPLDTLDLQIMSGMVTQRNHLQLYWQQISTAKIKLESNTKRLNYNNKPPKFTYTQT